jgi:hypothetical protein
MFLDLSTICYIVLLIANSPFIITFISLGYLNLKPQIFKEMQLLVLIAILINIFLKEIFCMQPLAGHTGWSFPSGHSHVFAVICLSLIFYFRNKFIFFISLSLMAALPFALVHYNHHLYSDVFAAYIYSIGTIGIFHSIKRLFSETSTSYSILILLSVLTVLNIIMYMSFNINSFFSTSITLIIFFCGSNLLNITQEHIDALSTSSRIKINMVATLGLFFIYLITQLIPNMPINIAGIINQTSYCLTAVLISFLIPKYLILNQARAGYVRNKM